jgi:hypothetical protein
MKWVVAVILVFIVGYTLVNIFFRKTGQPHRPYEDMNNRVTNRRLLDAGWQRIALQTRRPEENPAGLGALAGVRRGASGLGAEFAQAFAAKPALPASIDKVSAPAAIAQGVDCTVYFTASLGDQKKQLGDITLYRRGHELVFLAELEALPGGKLLSRWNDSDHWLSFPTLDLPPGRYTARLLADGPAALWEFEVR